jgi:cytochrome c oxidase subunit 1
MWGDHRRIYNYDHFADLQEQGLKDLRVAATCGLLIMIGSQLFFILNLIYQYTRGPKAGNNPWNATTLEWSCPSPPPHGNFHPLPTVYRGPYEYGVPGRESDFWPQGDKE